VPLTANPLPALVIVPTVLAPSPHSMLAEYSESFPSGLASVKVASLPLNDVPAVASMASPLALNAASAIFAWKGTL
jgi:hypothetical protein